MSSRPYSTLVLGLMLVAFAAPTHGSGAASEQAQPRLPAALRQFVATDLDGQRWTLEDLRGRVVLIDFWATWCAPCLAELPRLKSLRSTYSRDGFEILGISLDVTSRQSLISWLNRNRIDWPQVHQRAGYSGDLARLFDVDRLPRAILLDRDGRIAAVDVRGERLERLIGELVTEPAARPIAGMVKR